MDTVVGGESARAGPEEKNPRLSCSTTDRRAPQKLPTDLFPLLPLCRSWELQALDPSHRKSHRRQGRSAGAGIHTECPLMEVGQVFRVTGLPAPSPGLGVTYNVPVRHQRAVHQAMVDSGCMQTLVYQTLV